MAALVVRTMKTSSFNRLRRPRRLLIGIFALPITYVTLYAVLSAFGQYRPMALMGASHGQLYWAWAPLGFYDRNLPPDSLAEGWSDGILPQMFRHLWSADIIYVHKNRDWIMSWHTVDGQTVYQTNIVSAPTVK